MRLTGRRRAVALAVLIAVGSGLVGSGGPASAETDDQLRARARSVQQQLAQAQEGLADSGAAAARAAADLADVQARRPAAQAALDAATAAVRRAHDEDVELSGRLAVARADEQLAADDLVRGTGDIDATTRAVSQITAAAYRSGQADPALALAVGATDPDSLADRYVMVDAALRAQSTTLSRLQQQRALQGHTAERLSGVRAQVTDLRARAADHLVDTQAAEARAATAAAALDALAATTAQALATLQALQAVYGQQVAAAQAVSDELAAQLAARAAAAAAVRAAAGRGAPALSDTRGALGAPLATLTVTSPFGWRVHPVYGIRRLHEGTDFRAACGTPVRAAQDGEVVRAGAGTGYGTILVIDHGTVAGRPVATAYAHLSSIDVPLGASVRRGQVVAHSGSTGVGTACHLHFEVRVAGTPVDAAGWLAGTASSARVSPRPAAARG